MLKIKEDRPRTLDLDSPEGNVFVVMGMATRWSDQLGFNTQWVLNHMKSGDYTHAMAVFEVLFGAFIEIHGREELLEAIQAEAMRIAPTLDPYGYDSVDRPRKIRI